MTRFIQWMVKNPLPSITVAGLLLYGLVRLAYALFYDPFGVTPEDVGLGYQQTLAQSALAVFLIIIFTWFGAAAYLLFLLFYPRFLQRGGSLLRAPEGTFERRHEFILMLERRRLVARTERRKRLLELSIRAAWSFRTRVDFWAKATVFQASRWVLPISFLAAFSVAVLILIADAHHAASRAKNGQPVRGDYIFGIPFLGIRAERAEVFATRPTSGAKRLNPEWCLLYLGQSGGTTFLYTVPAAQTEGRTVRVPSSDVEVHTFGTRKACSSRE